MAFTQDEVASCKAAIIQSLLNGSTRQTSAIASGISRPTFYRWIDEDQDFKEACERAEASAIQSVINALFIAASRPDEKGKYNVGAIVFYLCNRSRQEWINVQRVEQTGAAGAPMVVKFTRDKPTEAEPEAKA